MSFFFQETQWRSCSNVSHDRKRHGIGKTRTLWMIAQTLQHVGSLTCGAFGLLKHVENVSQLAEQTLVVETRSRSMSEGKVAQQGGVVHYLYKRVGIGIRDVVFESSVWSLVEEPGDTCKSLAPLDLEGESMAYPKSKSSTPNLLYLISTFRYSAGTSGFKLSSSAFDDAFAASSGLASAAVRWLLEGRADSRAFSLRNFGAFNVLGDRSEFRVSSTWFLRNPGGFLP